MIVRLRDRAMFLLMLQGGLRPGEVLNLHLEDIEYGRKLPRRGCVTTLCP